ncbi:MAG TPA: hypothetical protein GXZ90_05200 [Clostridiales bacterium]|nr:hypothetical protein [Clostridiales bacterium]
MYKCLKDDFDKLERKLKRVIKKLEKYNLKYTFEVLGETVEPVNVINIGVPGNPEVIDTLYLDVISYNFTMEEIKLGNYRTIAIIKHNEIKNSDENLIYLIDPEITIDKKYRNIKSKCNHCNINRKRNTTVLLQDLNTSKEIIQVGLTCLKEYTGISDIDIIKSYMDLQDIFLDEVYIDHKNYGSYPSYVETIAYLAYSIKMIETEGYQKEVTKEEAWEKAYKHETDKINKKYLKKAEDVLAFFDNREFKDNFLENIKALLSNKYNKMSGLIAYAYLAYQKQLEYEINQEKANEINKVSDYVGNIGERIDIEVYLVKRFAFEGYYGMQQLYIFRDKDNNLYKWNTSKYIVDSKGESIEMNENKIFMKGTVKAHEEYKGAKQTVLTRCKVLKIEQ